METGVMYRRPGKKHAVTREGAEAIGLKALVFLAEDTGRLGRFMAETGLGPDDLRQRAGTAEVLGAVLGSLLSDESSLLVFTTGAGLQAEDVHAAYKQLGGGSPWDST